MNRLYQARGKALETVGQMDAARADHETALALARALDDPIREWESLVALGLLWAATDYDRSGVVLGEALDLARRIDEPSLIAHSLNRMGNWQVNVEHPRQALPLHREALAIFERLADRHGISVTLDLLGMAAYLAGDHRQAIVIYERAATVFSELGDRHGLITSLTMLSLRGGSFELGDAAADAAAISVGLRDGTRAIELAHTSGWRSGEAFALQTQAIVNLLQGNYRAALDLAGRSLQIAQEIGHQQWWVGATCVLGWIHLDVLTFDRARTHLEEALRVARDVRSAYWIQVVTGSLGQACAVSGALDRAVDVLGDLPDVDVPVQSLGERWLNYGHVHLALARGEARLALQLAERASPLDLDGAVTAESPRPALARAQALIALGRTAEAEAVLESVEAVARRQHARPVLWRCLMERGDVLIRRGRAAEGSRHVAAARALLDELANELDPGLGQQLRSCAFRTGRAATIAPRDAPLTGRELEVARLVAQGLTNREIAERLVISKWTADNHVANILRKLDVDRRAQVAAWLAVAELATSPGHR